VARELARKEEIPLEEALLRVEGEPPPLVATPRPEEEVPALLRKLMTRVETLEEEIQDLKRAIETLEKGKKPWWRFF
jgi:hypothetical protein